MSQDPILFPAPSGRWTSTNGQAAVAKRAKRVRSVASCEAWRREAWTCTDHTGSNIA